MKINVDGVVEELSEDLVGEYREAFKAACESMRLALEVIRSPGYDDRSTWKADCSNEFVKVYYKDINGQRYFAARTKIPLSAEDGFKQNWEGINTMKEWNDNVKFSVMYKKLGDNFDIAHYASNDKFMVKSREFLCGRMKKVTTDNQYILSARSCSLVAVPESKESVRAFLHVGVGRYIPDPENPDSSSFYDYMVCMDLKGMMLKSLANQALGKLIMSDVDNNRMNAIKRSMEK